MKSPNIPKQRPARLAPPAGAVELTRNGAGFAPVAAEMARRAYFTYLSQSQHPGQDMRHWLAIEAPSCSLPGAKPVNRAS